MVLGRVPGGIFRRRLHVACQGLQHGGALSPGDTVPSAAIPTPHPRIPAPQLTPPTAALPPSDQLIDYLIEGAYQRYLERRGSQPHTAACHELAHGMDEHNHHA